jgi:hypothetical protein
MENHLLDQVRDLPQLFTSPKSTMKLNIILLGVIACQGRGRWCVVIRKAPDVPGMDKALGQTSFSSLCCSMLGVCLGTPVAFYGNPCPTMGMGH